jgi:peptide deformylase
MALLPIYTYGTSVLRKKAKPLTEVSDSTVRLIMDMFETMRNANGIGLAATQVGSLKRVIVIDVSDIEEMKDVPPMTLVNPEIVESAGAWTMEEGCLSIPDVRDDVERAETIHLRFKDASFADVEIETGGLLARVILHEIDHLNGVLFTDRVPAEKKKLHSKELKKIQRGEFEVTYPVISAAKVPA